MKILICDDHQEVIDNLKTHISNYMKTHFIKADFTTSGGDDVHCLWSGYRKQPGGGLYEHYGRRSKENHG